MLVLFLTATVFRHEEQEEFGFLSHFLIIVTFELFKLFRGSQTCLLIKEKYLMSFVILLPNS